MRPRTVENEPMQANDSDCYVSLYETQLSPPSHHQASTKYGKKAKIMKLTFFACAILFAAAVVTAWPAAWPETNEIGVKKITPLNITVYYDSQCPNSKTFISDQLYPSYCKIKKYINLRLVPFSKTYKSTKGFVCQYGFEKCMGNIIHNCVLNRISDSETQVNYLNCAMNNLAIPGKIEKLCVLKSGLSIDDINDCYTSQEGSSLMLLSEVETRIMTFGPTFVPTIVFDSKYDDRDQRLAFANFESAVCEKFVDHGLVNVCSSKGMILNSRIC